MTKKEYELLQTLKSACEETYFHSIKVAELTEVMLDVAEKAGAAVFTEKEKAAICKGALLHDFGKIYIDKNILNKKSALSSAEKLLMRQHTYLGYDSIKDDLLEDEREIIKNICLYHHERIDGKGYEQKTDLPLYLQIMSICDVFDALHSDRSYKKGYPNDKCFELIRIGDEKNGVFDPAILTYLEESVKILGISDK